MAGRPRQKKKQENSAAIWNQGIARPIKLRGRELFLPQKRSAWAIWVTPAMRSIEIHKLRKEAIT